MNRLSKRFPLKRLGHTLFKMLLLLLSPIVLLSAETIDGSIQENYINKYKDIAIREMKRTGIPASIKLAQGLHESGAGQSYLAINGNNHFGIKCGGRWSGKTIYRKDDDYKNGKLVPSCFRRYRSAEESWKAHSEFLMGNYRYHKLFELNPTDYKAWARGLKAAGYATSRTYAADLIRKIQTYELYRFDQQTAPELLVEQEEEQKIELIKKPKEEILAENESIPSELEPDASIRVGLYKVVTKPTIVFNNDVKMTYAMKGESLKAISKRTKVSTKNLLRYNEQYESTRTALTNGARVYLQPKRTAYRGKSRWHEVRVGETMSDISQLYGIRLDKLYDRNLMKKGEEPIAGEHIILRNRAFEAPALRGKDNPKSSAKTSISTDSTKTTPVLTNEAEGDFMDMEGAISIDDVRAVVQDTTEVATGTTKEKIIKEVPKVVSIKEDTIVSTPTAKESNSEQLEKAQGKGAFYEVKPKDNLYRIAINHGLKVEELKKLNPALANNTIHPGDKIRVK